jgi:antitoxin (DNA-binding transcriptional repressor) of toxin-antitoxin stability system
LAKPEGWFNVFVVKTLTLDEATSGLGRWVERALAGEQIQICHQGGVVELRPAPNESSTTSEKLTPRQALKFLQDEGRLTQGQAEGYLREVHEERLAFESRRPG